MSIEADTRCDYMNVLTFFIVMQHIHALVIVRETHFLHIGIGDLDPLVFLNFVAFWKPQTVMPDRLFDVRSNRLRGLKLFCQGLGVVTAHVATHDLPFELTQVLEFAIKGVFHDASEALAA